VTTASAPVVDQTASLAAGPVRAASRFPSILSNVTKPCSMNEITVPIGVKLGFGARPNWQFRHDPSA
jgi:hypothetical protein